MKPGAFVTTHQSVVITKQDTVVSRPIIDDLHQSPPGNDIEKLHAKVHPTDIELLYTRLPADVLPTVDNEESSTITSSKLHG